MERFDPSPTGQTPALAGPAWLSPQPARRDGGFGERTIGELVEAIVTRLGRDLSSPGASL